MSVQTVIYDRQVLLELTPTIGHMWSKGSTSKRYTESEECRTTDPIFSLTDFLFVRFSSFVFDGQENYWSGSLGSYSRISVSVQVESKCPFLLFKIGSTFLTVYISSSLP